MIVEEWIEPEDDVVEQLNIKGLIRFHGWSRKYWLKKEIHNDEYRVCTWKIKGSNIQTVPNKKAST